MQHIKQSARLRTFLLLAIALLLSLGASWLAGERFGPDAYFVWTASELLACTACLIITLLIPRVALDWLVQLILLYTLFTLTSTALATVESMLPLRLTLRPTLWTGNANLLAATITVSAISSITLMRLKGLAIPVSLIVAFAVLSLTGSRTSMLALVVGGLTIWYLQLPRSRRPLLVLAAVVGTFVVSSFVFVVALVDVEGVRPKNTLRATDDLRHSSWNWDYAERYLLTKRSDTRPLVDAEDGAAVHEITATSGQDGLIVLQSLGVLEHDSTYTVSAYLRSDYEQEIVLSSNYSSTSCLIDSTWRRCVVHARGNGSMHLHFQLRTREPGMGVNFMIWGPQVEAGLIATEPQIVSTSVWSELRESGLPSRLTFFGLSESLSVRIAAHSAAMDTFLKSPWFGVGIGNIDNLPATNDQQQVLHSHNIFLQHLAEGGIVGLLSFMLPIIATLKVVYLQRAWLALPLLISIVLLNIYDYTFYHAGSFYIFWLTIGLHLRASDVGIGAKS